MLLLASAAVAIAAPAMAQPGYGYDRGYDQRGYNQRNDRGYDQRGWNNRDGGRGVQRDLLHLNNRVQIDMQRGSISNRVARAFFKRIADLQRAESRARDKNGGWLRPDQARDLQIAVDRVQNDLRQHENQYGNGYGNRSYGDRSYGDRPYGDRR
jgi:hypothetical protein